ncbi:hypothetical protein U1Q18_001390 [Sarracenia purpurea var. burkii]
MELARLSAHDHRLLGQRYREFNYSDLNGWFLGHCCRYLGFDYGELGRGGEGYSLIQGYRGKPMLSIAPDHDKVFNLALIRAFKVKDDMLSRVLSHEIIPITNHNNLLNGVVIVNLTCSELDSLVLVKYVCHYQEDNIFWGGLS